MELTPIEKHGRILFKRDDLYIISGVCGGKARTCLHLAKNATGLVTAGSRQSPQIKLVAYIANELGIPCRAHCPTGELSSPLLEAQEKGCEIIQHKAGYNSVIIARAREDALKLGYTNIPFGMECSEAVKQTSKQVYNIPEMVKRIIIPVGSGMSLCGVLWGLRERGLKIPVCGVMVGANPLDRIKTYAPPFTHLTLKMEKSELDYHKPSPVTSINGVELDPIYEAKCIPYIQEYDLLWIVGHRNGG